MARFEIYSNKAALATSDLLVIADSADTDADGHYKTKKILASLVSGGGTDTKAEQVWDFPAGSWQYNTTPAPLDTDTGANGRIKRQRFDDTTEEFVIGQRQVCSDVDLTGTVTFESYGYAVAATPTTTGKIELTVRHSAKTDDESWDAAYTTTISGDLTLNTTQDALDRHTWTGTLATLGWAANDHVRVKLSRSAPTTQNQSGDFGLTHFRVRIPRT